MSAGIVAVVVSFPAVLLIGFTLVDVVRRGDLKGGAKALWLVGVVVFPVVGTVLYLFARPMHIGVEAGSAQEPRVAQLLDLLDRRERGGLTHDEITAATRALVRDRT